MTFKLSSRPSASLIKGHMDPKHILLDFLYTVILSFLIAVFLTLAGFSNPFLVNLVMSLSFGVSICTLIGALFWVLNPHVTNKASMVLILVAGVVGGMLVGSQLGPFLLRRFFSIVIGAEGGLFLKSGVMAIFFGGGAAYFFYAKGRLKLVTEEAEEERMNRLAVEKEALETKLRMLQAQVEPHFLFNTLSNILSLIDTKPAKSKSMLMDLIHYLRTSLSRTMSDMTTLEQEMGIVRAYLSIQKNRLDERLQFRIDVPAKLNGQPFPPMLLQPLVENAIKHGLELKEEGGEITVLAEEAGDLLRISVADTGLGFSSFNKTGVGIANVKERIRLLYGEKGRLLIEENRPAGVRAVIEVPKQ
ncbi:MAG: sensor histidine kinase [Desulfobacteraceae bacterium]|nr:MAG: sensor histidine kinase [Desulfobacteraceae bacterium]